MLSNSHNVGPSGSLAIKVIPGLPSRSLTLKEMIGLGLPTPSADKVVNTWRQKNMPNFWRGYWKIAAARAIGVPHIYGQLSVRVLRQNADIEDLGIASLRVVTTAGVNFLTDAFQGLATISNMKFHGFGSGAAAEAVGNTTLTTEFTTQYVGASGTRPTGSQTEPGGSPNIYRTIATFTPDEAAAVTEHGLFDLVGAGTLWDRSVFSVVNLNGSGDALQATYDCTFAAGS